MSEAELRMPVIGVWLDSAGANGWPAKRQDLNQNKPDWNPENKQQ